MTHIFFSATLGLSIAGLVTFRIKNGRSPGVMNIILLISALLLALVHRDHDTAVPGVWHGT